MKVIDKATLYKRAVSKNKQLIAQKRKCGLCYQALRGPIDFRRHKEIVHSIKLGGIYEPS